MKKEITMPTSEWADMVKRMTEKAEREREETEGERLDSFNSEEEFLAAPSLNDEPPTEILTARLWQNDDGDRRWFDLELFDDLNKLVWHTAITQETGGEAGACDRAAEFADCLPAIVQWNVVD